MTSNAKRGEYHPRLHNAMHVDRKRHHDRYDYGIATLEDYYIDWAPVNEFESGSDNMVPYLMVELTSSGDSSLWTACFPPVSSTSSGTRSDDMVTPDYRMATMHLS
jgi:hypothetical protein